jgi:hypothetical protein
MHVGHVGGPHYSAMKKCDNLLQRKQHIEVVYNNIKDAPKKDYFT